MDPENERRHDERARTLVNEPMVSFIIPNWNHRQLLAECIASIRDTANTLSHEIVVVDNASTDDSAVYVAKNFPQVRWYQNDENLGYAKGVNLGVEKARGEILYLLNNDVVLLDRSTEYLVNFLASHPSAGAVAPLLFYPDGRLQISCRRFPTPPALLLEAFGIGRIGPFRRWKLGTDEHVEGTVPQPMMSALMVKKTCWEAVGPLDEGFPIFFNDVDWCYRLYNKTSFLIYLVPEAKAVHHYGASTLWLGYRKRLVWFGGLLRFYRKYLFS